ncbi:MAG: hypothetical protein ACI8W8_001081 [Rhodothermales bacterium]|jgi:hypothetical protein
MQAVEGLLKSFESIMVRLQAGGHARVVMHLCTIFFVAFLGYGLVVGSFSGEMQWLYAPAKILVGMMICCVFCYPSLFIFTCLSGADLRPGQVAARLLSCVSLAAILFVGFAPVAWVFSQSTNSLFFMGLLHLVFFMMAIIFGLKLLAACTTRGGGGYDYVGAWKVIFIVTILQMSTSLRPIIGTSDKLLNNEKKFLMEHWSDVASSKHPSRSKSETMRSTAPPTK